jgi:hypothetical protein
VVASSAISTEAKTSCLQHGDSGGLYLLQEKKKTFLETQPGGAPCAGAEEQREDTPTWLVDRIRFVAPGRSARERHTGLSPSRRHQYSRPLGDCRKFPRAGNPPQPARLHKRPAARRIPRRTRTSATQAGVRSPLAPLADPQWMKRSGCRFLGRVSRFQSKGPDATWPRSRQCRMAGVPRPLVRARRGGEPQWKRVVVIGSQ